MTKTKEYLIALFIYIIAYIYALIIAPKIGFCKVKKCDVINNVHESCLLNCKFTKSLTKYRGNNYYIGITDDEKKAKLETCLITWWGGTHFLLYLLLGYLTPSLFLETFILGVGFEIYESYAFDCHDLIDIVLNTSGFLVGRYFSPNI